MCGRNVQNEILLNEDNENYFKNEIIIIEKQKFLNLTFA